MTKEEVIVIVKNEIDKSISRYHTERIEKVETNIINEIKSLKSQNDIEHRETRKDISVVKSDISNIKGQLVWITAILVTLLGAILAGLIKYFLN